MIRIAMIYKKLYLILIFFLFVFVSCNRQIDVAIEKGDYVFTDQSYGIRYYIKVDTVFGSNLDGRLYEVDDEPVMEMLPFNLEYHKRNMYVEFSGNKKVKLKYEYDKRNNIFVGWYIPEGENKKVQYKIYKYIEPQFVIYDDSRYKRPCYDVNVKKNVIYGNVRGYWDSMADDTINIGDVLKRGIFDAINKKNIDLKMDVYLPDDDTIKNRPLLMLIHGGAFFIGDKASLAMKKWCNYFASLGYVCASINYRMGFKANTISIERTAYEATQDGHAAMRYLVHQADIYGIDTSKLFVGGSSAGSIIALNIAFMRNDNRPRSSYKVMLGHDLGDLESSGNKLNVDFNIKGVANMWGGVSDINQISNANASIISFHGDADSILPINYDYPFNLIGKMNRLFFNMIYGSECIDDMAEAMGLRHKLNVFHGRGHALHLDYNRKLNDDFYLIQNEIRDFFYDDIVHNPAVIVNVYDDNSFFSVDMTDVVTINWKVKGGFIVGNDNNGITVSWFSDIDEYEIQTAGCYSSGAAFYDSYVVKR